MNVEMLPLVIVAVAVPLPPWSVDPDGTSCVMIDDALADTLRGWPEDAKNTLPGEGIWARYNPDAPRQMVLLFDSKQTCQAVLRAMADHLPGLRLRASDVRKELDTLVRGDRERAAIWRVMSVKERQRLSLEVEKVFAGSVDRVAIVKALDAMHVRVRRAGSQPRARSDRIESLRLVVYEHLFLIVFGQRYRAPRPAD